MWYINVLWYFDLVMWHINVLWYFDFVMWYVNVLWSFDLVMWYMNVVRFVLNYFLVTNTSSFYISIYSCSTLSFKNTSSLACTKYLAFSKNAEETAVAGDACWCCIYRRRCWWSCRDRANSSTMTQWSNNELSTNTCRQLRQCAKCVPKHHISTVITCICARV